MRSLYYAALVSLSLTATACMRQQGEDISVVDETFVHKYGVEVPSDYWASAGEDGVVISTMADGVVINRSYATGVLNGETTYTFPHSSQLQKLEVYSQGTLVKEGEYFFDGTPKSETTYTGPGSKTVLTWYLSGTPKSVEYYQDNLLWKADYYTSFNQRDAGVENYEGTRLVRDDYGQLLTTDTIKGGRLALRMTYHPNGSPKETIPFNNGVVEGTKRTYHPAGEPNTVEQWAAGGQHGMTTVYQHGERFADVPYANGNKHGVELRYRDGSTVVQKVSWDNGQLHGPTTTYIGDTEKSDWYYQGKPTSKTDYDFMVNKPVVR